MLRRLRVERSNQNSSVAVRESIIQRGKIIPDDSLILRIHFSDLRFKRLKQLQLSISRGKVSTPSDVGPSGPDLCVKPDQVEINVIGLHEVLVIAVEQRRRCQPGFDGI